MHVATFYSFKGGVGRTMALVNVGIDLARRGRRVLLVDFDLEAPGIDTYQVFADVSNQQGMVEYISDYLQQGEPGDARDYLLEIPKFREHGGCLSLMPAGDRNQNYGERLFSINWHDLYKERDGYLLMEHLKEQWESLNLDYVLIDSRTGHTEVGGICTRQLPDSVFILAIPNEQNLSGLRPVVQDIREERAKYREKHIALHLVFSNVPHLDDEEEILAKFSARFRKELGLKRLHIIYHYSSLALLQQQVFVEARPRSRLADNYRRLARTLVEHNIDDRRGVTAYLKRQQWRTPEQTDEPYRLEDILKAHRSDPEILFQCAQVERNKGDTKNSLALLEQAVDAARARNDPVPALFLLYRGRTRDDAGRRAAALEDLAEAVSIGLDSGDAVRETIMLARQLNEYDAVEKFVLSAIETLDLPQLLGVLGLLQFSRSAQCAAGRRLVEAMDNGELDSNFPTRDRPDLWITLIGAGMYSKAMMLLGPARPDPSEVKNIQDAFNYAMAGWAETGEPPIDFFARVVELAEERTLHRDANYQQCVALSLGLLARSTDAEQRLEEARTLLGKDSFSCWRYLHVERETFEQDLNEIGELIRGTPVRPRFMADEERD